MKIYPLILALCFVATGFGQSKEDQIKWREEQLNAGDLNPQEYRDRFLKYDFGLLWTKSDYPLGFIGQNYQRLHIKIVSAKRDADHPDSYLVSGKSMVKKNICDFTGEIKITNVRLFKTIRGCEKDTSVPGRITQEGIVAGEYHFAERRDQKHAGTFDGVFCSSWYIDKDGKLQYDDLEAGCDDGYCNNQFLGTWKGYHSKKAETCNWGDSRIPQSGELDDGAGEFYPDKKYLRYGWQTYMDAWEKEDYDNQARQEEQRKWWR
jgi:hypothetical protein